MALVLGGGWAGVLSALELKLRYPSADVIVLDRGPLGGLLRSEEVKGHIFDIGGSHVIFSRDTMILNQILEMLGKYLVHQRKAYVNFANTLVPYPLENGLYVLPPEDRAEAAVEFLEKYISLGPSWRPLNFAEWVNAFGSWIADKYLKPYNLKIWKRPLEDIDVDWVYTPGRLPLPDWRSVVKSAAGVATVGYVEQSRFYYPVSGGISEQYFSALRKALSLGVKVVEGEEIREVKKLGGEWIVNRKFKSKLLINTIPLPELVKAINAPEDIIKAADRLDYNQVIVVGVGLYGMAPEQHWIYEPDSSIVFHRYAWISNYSPNNAPRGHSSVIAEITAPPYDVIKLENLIEDTLRGLDKAGVLEGRQVLFVKAWHHKYGYPVHTISSNKARSVVLQWLRDMGVYSVGRWGSWQYWNTDKVYQAVKNMVNGI